MNKTAKNTTTTAKAPAPAPASSAPAPAAPAPAPAAQAPEAEEATIEDMRVVIEASMAPMIKSVDRLSDMVSANNTLSTENRDRIGHATDAIKNNRDDVRELRKRILDLEEPTTWGEAMLDKFEGTRVGKTTRDLARIGGHVAVIGGGGVLLWKVGKAVKAALTGNPVEAVQESVDALEELID